MLFGIRVAVRFAQGSIAACVCLALLLILFVDHIKPAMIPSHDKKVS